MGFLNRLWSASDFWDKEENARQRQQFAQTKSAPVQKAAPVQTRRSAAPYSPQFAQQVNKGLDRGLSWEDISRNTGLNLKSIRSFSQLTRPEYGIKAPESMEEKIRTARYGVLANNKEAQGQFLDSTKASRFNPVTATLGSAKDAAVAVPKAVVKGAWETADVPVKLVQRDWKGAIESADQSLLGGAKRFGQSVAGAALSPVSNRLADQERKRAERLLTPAYENMYQAYGYRPGMGSIQAGVEAGQADYNLRIDPLTRSGISPNDSTSTLVRKVGAQAAEAGLDILTAPTTALATGQAAKSALKTGTNQFLKTTGASALLSGAGNLAYVSQMDGANRGDYIKAGLAGAALGAALPITTNLATKAGRGSLVNAKLAPAFRGAPEELLAVQRVQNQRAGWGNVASEADFAIARNALAKNGVSIDDVTAIDRMLGDQRTYETRVAQRKQTATEAVERVKNPVPLNEGGFITGPLAGDFSKAKQQGRVFEGVDGKPRFEVDDSGAKVNIGAVYDNNYNANLDQVLDHPTLFKNYPELKNIKVTVDALDNGTNAVFDGKTKTITLNENQLEGMDVKGTILHEIQHGIQDTEGFARGGSEGTFTNKLIKERDSLRPAFLRENEIYKNTRKAITENFEYNSPRWKEEIAKAERQYKNNLTVKRMNEVSAKIDKLRLGDANTKYRNLAGEAEARAVQARMNMPMSERYVTPKTKAGDYVGSHQAPTRGDGDYHAPASDVTGGAGMFPDDIYTDPQAYRYYGHGGDAKTIAMDKKSIELIRAIKDNPDAEVTMYRAVPKGKATDVNPGDWVTLNKDYAQMHNSSQFDGKGVILEKKVKADELYTDGNSIHEFGYDPRPQPRSTFYDSLDVPKEDLIIRNGDGKAMSIDPLKSLKQEARTTEPIFERDINTGKMKMQSSKQASKEKYSIANSDISRTKNPGMNQDGFTVEDWGGKKRFVSLDDASPETKMKVRKAEAEFERAKANSTGVVAPGTKGPVQIAREKLNDAYSDAIDDLKLQDYATTENGGRTFNSKYNDWLETKYKDRNIDSATIKDMATNPQKYRSQFEAETATQSQPPKPTAVQPDPLESLKQEAKRFGYDKGYTEEGQIANTIDELMKEQNAVREVGIPLYDKYKDKLDGTKTITEMMTPAELKAYRAAEAKSEKASKLLKDYFDYKKGQTQSTTPSEYKYKMETGNGTTKYNTLTSKNSFQDINGERHPIQSDVRITVRDYNGTGMTRSFKIEGVSSQKNFNNLLKKYADHGEIISAIVDETPALNNRSQRVTGRGANPKDTSTPGKVPESVRQQPQTTLDSAESISGRQTPQQSQEGLPPQTKTSSNSSRASSSDADYTTKPLSDKEWGSMLKEADEFNAVAGAAGTKNSNKLVEAINTDNKITRAAREAQQSGREMHFYAAKDKNGRSIGIQQFDPRTHRIEAGFVVDQNGRAVGNHIKVDQSGIQVNVGGDLVNMGKIVGDTSQWRGKYRVTETMSRNIDRLAPNKEVAQRTKDFLIGHKVKAEANYRTELEGEYKKLGDRIKSVESTRPRGVSKDQFKADIFDLLDGKKTDAEIRSSYGKPTADAILSYKNETKQLYSTLLDRVNSERIKFGMEPVQARKDYITHLQELNGSKSFVGEVKNTIRNSFTDEGQQTTRNGIPGNIAGRSEGFEPRTAYNKFMQRRTGDKAVKDPFRAVQEYLEPALYNIHMTESTVRARAIETAFRTASELQQMKGGDVLNETKGLLSKYQAGDNAKLVTGFQEYANTLAKKTNRFDRPLIDASDATARGLKEWQRLQRIGGRATILGNVSSTLAQPLNQVITLADAGPKNYIKGIIANIGGDKAIEQSDFIKARQTKAVAPIRGRSQKVLDAGGVPLELVEMASVKNTWHSMYAKAKSSGLTGAEAIKRADYDTERLVAGRGIADRPEIYRSTVASGLLQYTLEVSAQNKAFWQDLSVPQKATFLASAMAMNTVYGAVTGYEPLPDFLGATLETGGDLLDENDDRTAGEKLLGGGQRLAAEAVSMNPVYSGLANNLLSQDARKTVFGSDSDLGRYPGTAAPVQVLQNVYRAGKSAADGNMKDARNSALKVVPFGNQARKTITGAEANANGYAVDRNGKKTFETGDTLASQAKNLLFGPSSTAGDYFNEKYGTGKLGKPSSQKNSGTAVRSVDDAVEGIKSSYGGKFAELTQAELKEAAKTDSGAKDYMNKLAAVKKAGEEPDDLPKGLGTKATDVLTDYNRLTTEGKKNWGNRKADKEVTKTINSWLPKNVEKPPITNETAKDWAYFEKRKAEGTIGKLEEIDERKKILRAAYNSQLNEDERDLYRLSKARLQAAYESGLINDSNINKALAVEKQLFDAGLIDKETLRKKLGLSARGYKGSSGRGGRGGKKGGKYDWTKNMFASGSEGSGSVGKKLRQIVESAQKV